MRASRWLAVLALALLLMGHAVEGKRRKAQAREVEEQAQEMEVDFYGGAAASSDAAVTDATSSHPDAANPSPHLDDSRLVTFRNHYDNQTLLILWTGTIDDESHISSPVLVSEVEAGLDGQVNTFPNHVFLVQAKETLKIIGEKIAISSQYLYHIGPVPSVVLSTQPGDVQEVKTIQFKPSNENTNSGSRGAGGGGGRRKTQQALPHPHPNPHITLLGTGTTAMSAKFRSLVPSMDMWYEDGRGGTFQGTLTLGRESTTNTYEGHVFFFTDSADRKIEYARFTMDKNRVLYLVQSDRHPVPQNLQDLTANETKFMTEYKARTGINWRHYYGPLGPRPPPTLFMWPAAEIGQRHKISSTEGFWHCRDNTEYKGHASKSSASAAAANACQHPHGAEFELEVISLEPRVFLIKNFFSAVEADEIIAKASARLEESTVGNKDAGGSRKSDTRTSRNSWVKRQTSAITESLFKRAADLLQLEDTLLSSEKNAEEMQVVRYVDGQKYDSHHDWGVSGFPESRFITLLLYLTDQPKDPRTGRTLGGETSFPKGYDGKGFKVGERVWVWMCACIRWLW